MPLEHDAGLQLDESQETSAQPRSRPDAAHSVVHEWDATLAALSPVIGRLGVAALYDRSVRLSSLRFVWLAELGAASQAPVDLELLRAVLGRQSNEQVLACAAMLRQSFTDLLTSLSVHRSRSGCSAPLRSSKAAANPRRTREHDEPSDNQAIHDGRARVGQCIGRRRA